MGNYQTLRTRVDLVFSFQASGNVIAPNAIESDLHVSLLTDFWLGDQFCSLSFSLASLWTLGCSLHNHWAPDSYTRCGLGNHWQTPFVLSSLPSIIRFLQCVKRYSDSGLYMHMINVSLTPTNRYCLLVYSSNIHIHRPENIYPVCCTTSSIICGDTVVRRLAIPPSYCFVSEGRS